LNAAGACGDATRADAEIGRQLVERAAAALATLVAEVSRAKLSFA
jgi:creatinine amidohydrolase/Fe(II)-dependent formamide hydrolase-like protein